MHGLAGKRAGFVTETTSSFVAKQACLICGRRGGQIVYLSSVL